MFKYDGFTKNNKSVEWDRESRAFLKVLWRFAFCALIGFRKL